NQKKYTFPMIVSKISSLAKIQRFNFRSAAGLDNITQAIRPVVARHNLASKLGQLNNKFGVRNRRHYSILESKDSEVVDNLSKIKSRYDAVKQIRNSILYLAITKESAQQNSVGLLRQLTEDPKADSGLENGGSQALRKLFETVSSKNHQLLESICTPKLYSVFKSGLEKNQAEGITSHYNIKNIHSSSVDICVNRIGPREAFNLEIPLEERAKEYDYLLQSINIRMISKAFKHGYNMQVDLKVDADVEYRILRNNEEVYRDDCKRAIFLTLETPFYKNQGEFNISYKRANGESRYFGSMGSIIPDLQWKVADVDFLVFVEEMEEFLSGNEK
ncbi:hypothetical protein BB560_005811, partial [Smittium megazygosporum]